MTATEITGVDLLLRPSTWTPAQRVAQLLADKNEWGWTLEFVEASEFGAVHVVGPDEDQPGYADVADYLIARRFRAVCGRVISRGPLDGYLGAWADERLCRRCRRAFGDDSWLIFDDNNDEVQPGDNWRIRQHKLVQREED
ncbi:hypothetical protein [Micromonospora sp. NPDC047730]|uniref:hypothetical protein n=1 Tax=Micromonospora sp. NPDC047730 TaxID=3364253 RepID=UPI0037154010